MTEGDWLASGIPILNLEASRGWPSARKQRLFAVACCRHIRHLLPDARWQDCLAVAERYADRRARRYDLGIALTQNQVTATGGATYADLLRQCVATAVRWACEERIRTYAGQVAIHAACAAGYAALPPREPYVPPAESRYYQRWSAAEKAEMAAQIALVYEVCGDPSLPVTGLLRPLPGDLKRIAAAAYEGRSALSGALDSDHLAVLSDAVEEGGFAGAELLAHLRSPGPHVRGCWALDLILSKDRGSASL
jgi:hypothetical protein